MSCVPLILARRRPQAGDVIGHLDIPDVDLKVIAVQNDGFIVAAYLRQPSRQGQTVSIDYERYRRLIYVERSDGGPVTVRVPFPDGDFLSDRRFGRIVARMLARGGDRMKRRHPRGAVRALPENRWIPPRGFLDMSSFHDAVRLTVESTESQRRLLDRIADARGLPRFFDK